MMLNINLDYDWIMVKVLITSIILNGRKQICYSHLGRRFLFSARTKRLLRRLPLALLAKPLIGFSEHEVFKVVVMVTQ